MNQIDWTQVLVVVICIGLVLIVVIPCVAVPLLWPREKLPWKTREEDNSIVNGLMFVWLICVVGCSFVLSNQLHVSVRVAIAVGAGVLGVCLWTAIASGARVRHHPCPKCRKQLDSQIPWTCGECDGQNNSMLLFRCDYCKKVAKAFQCYFCNESFSLVDNNPATDVHAARKTPPPPPPETLGEQQARHARELGEREFQKKRLQLEIDVAKLDAEANPPGRVGVDRHQEELRRMWAKVDEVKHRCKSIQQTVVEEVQLHAEIDALTLNDPLKERTKEMVSRMMESVRIDLGANVEVKEKSHS
jgi:hypothetical protein